MTSSRFGTGVVNVVGALPRYPNFPRQSIKHGIITATISGAAATAVFPARTVLAAYTGIMSSTLATGTNSSFTVWAVTLSTATVTVTLASTYGSGTTIQVIADFV
jgi:hypothetical protein